MQSDLEKFWACPVCKSHRVQAQMWVRVNTEEVIDDTERYYWCDACEEDRGDGETDHLIELPAAETREGVAPERVIDASEITVIVTGGAVGDVLGVPRACKVIVKDYDIEVYDWDELEEDEEGCRFRRIELCELPPASSD